MPTSTPAFVDNMSQTFTPSLPIHAPVVTVGATLAPFDPNAFDPDKFTNIDWNLFSSPNLDFSGSKTPFGNINLSAAPLSRLDTMNPMAANTYGTYPMGTSVQSFVGMPPLPNNYLGSSVTYNDNTVFPSILSTLRTVPAVANGASASVFSASTNLDDGGARKRKSTDGEGMSAQKMACKTTTRMLGAENESGVAPGTGSGGVEGGGAGASAGSDTSTIASAPGAPALKQRKKRSDAGVLRGRAGSTVPTAPANQKRKERSDKGKLRRPRRD
ncbi:hypothetical protein B0H19DRAFT_1064939 [Mycena capillaripes]|nr:hypothetical protein B0H19DRAFT_1064939 [Mycena capillaripes]